MAAVKPLLQLREDLEGIRELIVNSNPDPNSLENRFYTFLTELMVNLDTYVIEPPPYTGKSFSSAFNTNQFN